MTATPAQVAAAQEAMGCEPGTVICRVHREYLIQRGCPVARAVADAVAAAGSDPATIAAEALREFADEMDATYPADIFTAITVTTLWVYELTRYR